MIVLAVLTLSALESNHYTILIFYFIFGTNERFFIAKNWYKPSLEKL